MYIIDRFEMGVAICEAEDGAMVKVPRGLLPESAVEGDCVTKKNGVFELNTEATALRKQCVDSKFRRLASKRKA